MADLKTILVEMSAGLKESLNPKDKAFFTDLANGFTKYGKLSEKQAFWINKLYERAKNGGTDLKAEFTIEVNVGSMEGVLALFNAAKAKLKWPKIVLRSPQNGNVELSVASARAKCPGTINVTDGKPYGQNIWYGRVDKDGVWTQNPKVDIEVGDMIAGMLSELSKDPAGVAKKSALLNGRCCFCNKKLTDPKSTAAGFGPVCADNFGLTAQWKNAVNVLENA